MRSRERSARRWSQAQSCGARSDKNCVSPFFENARSLFEAAESASLAGHAPSHLTILIAADGAIRMMADSDWPLDRLLAHNGGRMAYRVSEQAGKLRVEGRAASAACRFEADSPRNAPRRLAALASPLPALLAPGLSAGL
jgi:hypothetical protein